MKVRSLILAIAVASVPGLLASAQTAQFNLRQSTIIPGSVLPPGSYSIQVVDHLQDRYLIRVEGSQQKTNATFIAVPSHSITGSVGAVVWNSGPSEKPALRGFVFGKGTSPVEFVYPKDEAVSIAKQTSSGVLAVDPASEGKPAELAQLNKEDLQVVTLWMLTPQRIDASSTDVKIAAAKYQAPAEGSQVASLHQPKLPIKTLPHTASTLPLILLAGIFAAIGAFALRQSRLRIVRT
jgi:hypothetical protein